MAEQKLSVGVRLFTDLKDFTSGFKKAQDTSVQFGDVIDKKLTSPLRTMEAQLRALKQTQRKAITAEEYQKVGTEIKNLQGDIDKFKGKVSQSKSPINSLISGAKGLLPAFGFAALAAGAGVAFQKIIASTDTLGTEWEASVNGMKEGLNEFWRTVATGDWSNFTDRMRDAIKVAKDYTYALDDIEDKTRSLRMIEADSRAEQLKLEEMLKNKGLSNAERLKAGQDRISLEDDLAKQRLQIAQETFDAEASLTAAQTKLSKERLTEIIRDLDSESKQRAKKLNEQIAQYEQLKKANVSIVTSNTGLIFTTELPATREMITLKNEINSASGATKLYAEQIKLTGRTTDEQLEKMVVAYEGLKSAENSGIENTKKVRTMVNSLIADTNKELEKEWKLRQRLDQIATEKAAPKLNKIEGKKATQVTGKTYNSSELGMLGYMGKTIEANTAKYQKFKQELADSMIPNIMSLSDSFNQLGNSIGGAFGQFLSGIGNAIGMIPTLIAQISALTVAQVSGSQAITTAKGSEAIASGTAASQSVPFPFNLIALAATIGAIISALATPIKGKHAFGGVIPGTSFAGDKVLTRVNSGEEILTANDPRHVKNGGKNTTGNGVTEVTIMNEAKMKGEDIYILMKKVEKRIARRTGK